ncbi:hypothetical protein JCM1841_005404 [Sporobolomyces salmonicolor]
MFTASEYYTRCSLTTDFASVYILGMNHGAHDDADDTTASEVGWPTDSPTSPTAPVRLVDQEKRTRVPFVDLGTCRGENGVLLETIEVDLWRPIVMSFRGSRRLTGKFGDRAALEMREDLRVEATATAAPAKDGDPRQALIKLALPGFAAPVTS